MIKKIQIVSFPDCTKIYADGKEIDGVISFSCQQSVDSLPTVKIEILPAEIEYIRKGIIYEGSDS